MKRSEINGLVSAAQRCFETHGWALPPGARWDVTDFGLGDVRQHGLVLVNLAEEPEYCEKLMYARRGMVTPAHAHRVKKEDIIARTGTLRVQLWADATLGGTGEVAVKINGEARTLPSGASVDLPSGHRITLVPGVYHAFEPMTDECVVGEVSTANDDLNDNFFVQLEIGRYATIDEDEPPLVRLLSDV